jgi:hypothetical protein
MGRTRKPAESKKVPQKRQRPASTIRLTERTTAYCLLALVVIFVARIVATYPVFNDVADTSVHISAGLEYLRDGVYQYEPQHPPLARIAVAALPYWVADLKLGPFENSWGGDWAKKDMSFYWETLTLARMGNLAFAIPLLLFTYLLSSKLYGKRAGLAACAIVSCCPGILANSGVATLDIAVTATMLAAAYFGWRWSLQPGWRYCLLTGVAAALAFTTKFSTVGYLPPIIAAYFLIARWNHWRDSAPFLGESMKASVLRGAAFLTVVLSLIWAIYLFDIGPIAPPDEVYFSRGEFGGVEEGSPPRLLANWIGSTTVPAPSFWMGIIDVLSHNQLGHTAYLLGELSAHGWWYYFLVVGAVKTTLPLLAMVGMTIIFWARREDFPARAGTAFAVAPIVVVLGISMMSNINIGVRHILPIYPFFAILASALFGGEELLGRPSKKFIIPLLLFVWHAGESAWAHPDYLPYFNEIARGHEDDFLADSNLDWGQDLARLGRFVNERELDSMLLYYEGGPHADRFGVTTGLLPPGHPDFGWVGIGVNEFKGVVYAPSFDPLRNREPVGRVGKSILLFRLKPEEIFNMARLQAPWAPPEHRALSQGLGKHPRNGQRLGRLVGTPTATAVFGNRPDVGLRGVPAIADRGVPLR